MIDFEPFSDDGSFVEPMAIRQLRPYQEEAFAKIMDAFGRGLQRVLLVLGTGCGKTIVFSHICRHVVNNENGRVLVIAHSDELLDQARDKLEKISGIHVGKEKASDRASLHDRIVVASVQTLRGSRLWSWPKSHFALIVVDETHRVLAKGYQDLCAHFDARVLGVTATPSRGDKRSLGDFFEELSYEYGIVQAVKDGWLVRPVGKTVPLSIDLRDVKNARTSNGSDFDQAEICHRIEPYLDEIAKEIVKEVSDRIVLAFLPSVDLSQKIAARIRRLGMPAEWVSGEDALRTDKVERFKSGAIRFLACAQLLTEGFDHDSVDCIVCLRPTKLVGLYTQIVGRGTRPLASIVPALNNAADSGTRRALISNSSKPLLLLLDFLWLYEDHKDDLMRPANIVAPPAIARKMRNEGDLLVESERASRDLLDSFADALEAAQKRRARPQLIDPMGLGELDEEAAAKMEETGPEKEWHSNAPSEGQLKLLKMAGIKIDKVRNKGHASKLITYIMDRRRRGLAELRTVSFLKRRGIDALNWSKDKAKPEVQRQLAIMQQKK